MTLLAGVCNSSGVIIILRCGSVIVDLLLRFNQSVSERGVVSVLKTAAQQHNFGNFNVDPNSIKQTSPSPTASPSPTSKGGTQGIVKALLKLCYNKT